MTAQSLHFQYVGQIYHDFKLTNVVEIPGLQCILRELTHIPTQAQVMHIANEDPENLFCLSFQTLPHNSNGVAHILEHTVLCGSKMFPVSDPFFAMNRRSLNTFMNALTGADFTCYPAATQVPKDFYNLLEVYLDAVFHPILKELSFLQEGHRLEFSNPSDPSTPLEFKGIVYNEMKGALASGSARLSEALNESLFPNLTYGFNSGGDPKDIPNLTYAELIQFHEQFYHPSRCLFFFYGNMPLEEHLDFISNQTLQGVTPIPPLPPLPKQPRFLTPVRRSIHYPIPPEESTEDKALVGFGWLTCHLLDQFEALALSILEIILMDTDASPLKMALLKSGLCKQASSAIEDDASEIPWFIILKGCHEDRAEEIERVLKETLETVVKEGISLEMIENAIHQLEFHRSEITGDYAPFGLSLFMRSALLKQHGAQPDEGLRILSLFEGIRRKNLESPHYFTELIKKYLLDNTHFVRITMIPDKNLGKEEADRERTFLDEIRSHLSNDQIDTILAKSAQLEAYQNKENNENLDILPKVSLSDVSLIPRDYLLKEERVGSLTVFSHHCFTNDIVYADLVFNLPDIPEEDLPYLRLLTVMLSQIGCGGRDYKENLDYIQGNTGGVGATLSLNLQADDHNSFTPTLHIKGKALYRKDQKLFSLIHEMVTSADLHDVERLKIIILKHYSGLESSLNHNALKYAINLSSSQLHVSAKIANDLYGLNYFWKIREIATNFDDEAPKLISKLEEIYLKIMCVGNPHLVIGCDAVMYQKMKDHGFYGLMDLEAKSYTPWTDGYSLDFVPSQARIIASPIAFNSHVFPTVSYTHPHAPALHIVTFLFDNITLHTRIREQGGAYGGGAASNTMSGIFYFYSYRDPQIAKTLQAFHEAIDTILHGDFDEEDLEEAKLEMIQVLDSPISPGSRAEAAYGWMREGKSLDMRNTFRSKILALTKEDIIEAVKQEIVPNIAKGSTVVFAGKELLEKENPVLESLGYPPLQIFSI
jgi:presequence protease